MLNTLSEQTVHKIRWGLAIGWSGLIASLFYDPVSQILTKPDNIWSPFRLSLDPAQCITLQGVCLPPEPYAVGARFFWATVVPAGLMIIFVLGHEFWRRICPLAFFSQIPRALGIQRKLKTVSSSGKSRYELVSINKKSWLGRNFLFLQFSLLVIGLIFRILFTGSDRLALGIWLVTTIAAAILVGYLYAGKSWCQYFCPMAPVQMVFTGPRGLLGSQAHWQKQKGLTQSTCREIDPKTQQEKSACVGCKSPCIDIDAERSYWDRILKPDQKFLLYGYLGLVFGFYFYYFLYAGNWEFFASGAWAYEPDPIGRIWQPGFYLWGRAIALPKLVATPLTLVGCVFASFGLLSLLEKAYRHYLHKKGLALDNAQILHQIFTVLTFSAWNLYWILSDGAGIGILPEWAENLLTGSVILVSGLWFYQTIGRTSEQYGREGLANTLRRQLDKLGFNVSQFLDRQNDDLKPDELYVLAKVLPDFSQAQRLEAYKDTVKAAISDNIVSSVGSALLKELQRDLNVTQDEHYAILASLGVEDPSLFDPSQQTSLENQIRIDSYRQNLESLVADLVTEGTSIPAALEYQRKRITHLRREYSITDVEHERVLATSLGQAGGLLHNAEILLEQLEILDWRCRILATQPDDPSLSVYLMLRNALRDRQKLVIHRLLSILKILGPSPAAQSLAPRIAAYEVLPAALKAEEDIDASWQGDLDPEIYSLLVTPIASEKSEIPPQSLGKVLETILQGDLEPLLKALSLRALYLTEPAIAIERAEELLQTNPPTILAEEAEVIAESKNHPSGEINPLKVSTLSKTFCLCESPFFNQLGVRQLIELAASCQSRQYDQGEVIWSRGEQSQEILIIFEGMAMVTIPSSDGPDQTINQVPKGETLGELGVLTQASRSASVIAATQPTIALVLKAEKLDSLLSQRPALARGLLTIISKRLQKLTKRVEAMPGAGNSAN